MGRIGQWSYNSRKLASGDPPSGNGTLLANGVAPLVNGEIGGRRGTVPHKPYYFMKNRIIIFFYVNDIIFLYRKCHRLSQ